MSRKRRFIAAIIGIVSTVPAAFAQVEAPEGYPIVSPKSDTLLLLNKGEPNLRAGKNLHSIGRSVVAYSPHHDVFLHVWHAHLWPNGDLDPGREQALFYRIFDVNGAPVTQPRVLYTFDIHSGQPGDPSGLQELPGDITKYIYAMSLQSLSVVYEPDSQHFLLTWSNPLTNTSVPAYPEPTLAQKAGNAILGLAISRNAEMEWENSGIEPIVVSEGLVPSHDAKAFSRVGMGGLHRFTKTPSGNISAMLIQYSAETGFSANDDYIVDIDDEIDQFDSVDEFGVERDASPHETRNYGVAYDPENDRYTVSGVRVDQWVSVIAPDGGRDVRTFSGVVSRTFDASLIDPEDNGGDIAARKILAAVSADEYIYRFAPPSLNSPALLQFQGTDTVWLPGPNASLPEVHVYWATRDLEPSASAGGGISVSDHHNISVQRYTISADQLVPLGDVFKATDNTVSGTNIVGAWDSRAKRATVAYSNGDIYAFPGNNQAVLSAPAAYPGPATKHIVRTATGLYMHHADDHLVRLFNLDWQWADLSINSDLAGGGSATIASDDEFTIEVVVSNLDIGELPLENDSGDFSITIQGTAGLELVSTDDRLSGNLADGFGFDAASGGIAADGSTAFEFVFRNANGSSADQAIDMTVDVKATDHYDYNAENDSSTIALVLDGSDVDSVGGSGDGSGSDSGNSSSNGSGDGTGPGNPGSGSGGGALFWLLGVPALLRLRR